MRVVVIGGGAVGSFLATTLVTAGCKVTVVRRSAPQQPGAERLTITGPGTERRVVGVSIARTTAAVEQTPHVVILAVKMPDLPSAIELAARWPTTTIVSVQNGVGADDRLLETRPGGGLVAGSLTVSVELDRDTATIHRLSQGGIGLAPVRGDVNGSIEVLAARLQAGGLRARIVGNASAMRWSKLLANLLANATSAILDLDPWEIYSHPGVFRIEQRQLREALAVVRRLGLRPVPIPGADVRPLMLAERLPAAIVQPVMRHLVGLGRGGKAPSLRRHMLAGGGPSEVDWLNGAVARVARQLGWRAPVNARLTQLVTECSLDPERWAWFRGRPERLVAELSLLTARTTTEG